MKIWKDKDGNKLTASEFKERWKQGIQNVTQEQQLNAQIRFTYMTLFGIMCGVVFTAMKFNTLWWLVIILVAAFANTGVGLIALLQKRLMFEKIKKMSTEAPLDIPA